MKVQPNHSDNAFATSSKNCADVREMEHDSDPGTDRAHDHDRDRTHDADRHRNSDPDHDHDCDRTHDADRHRNSDPDHDHDCDRDPARDHDHDRDPHLSILAKSHRIIATTLSLLRRKIE